MGRWEGEGNGGGADESADRFVSVNGRSVGSIVIAWLKCIQLIGLNATTVVAVIAVIIAVVVVVAVVIISTIVVVTIVISIIIHKLCRRRRHYHRNDDTKSVGTEGQT